jgi:hypothetical protein
MRRTIALVLAGAVLALPTAATATIRPQKGMSGLWLGMTKAQVQGKLGRPVGTGGGRFYYARVWVGFRLGRVVEITTTRSTERTASGIAVGSREAAVRRAYPSAVCGQAGRFRRCRLGSGKPGSRATDFLIGGGLVLQITVQLLPT